MLLARMCTHAHGSLNMKKALIAALAALSATAWVATPAYAQGHGRGQHERGGEGHGDRGDRGHGGDRGDRGDRGHGGDEGQRGQHQGQAHNAPPTQHNPAPLGGHDVRGRGGDNHGDVVRHDDGRGRGDWSNGGRDNHGRGHGDDGGRWRGDDGRGHGGGDARQRHDDGRGRGDWNDGRHRGGRDFSWNDWGRGRDGHGDRDRYNRWRSNHRDWDRPRYRDWRQVHHGHYFDRGYALIVGGYWGHNYFWWGYDGWRRPHRPWRVGYILPYDLYWEPIPYDLYYRLPPAPYGCRYVLVGRDVLLIAVSTGLILDALYYY